MNDTEMCEQFARLIGKYEVKPGANGVPTMMVTGANGNTIPLPVTKYLTSLPTVLKEAAIFCANPVPDIDDKFTLTYTMQFVPGRRGNYYYTCDVEVYHASFDPGLCLAKANAYGAYWRDRVSATENEMVQALMYALIECAIRIPKKHQAGAGDGHQSDM